MFQNRLRNSLAQLGKRHQLDTQKKKPGSDKPCKTSMSLHSSEPQLPYLLNIKIITK